MSSRSPSFPPQESIESQMDTDWTSIWRSSPMSPQRVLSITSSGVALVRRLCGTTIGRFLFLIASRILRPAVALSPSGFSTRIPRKAGDCKASRTIDSCDGEYVLTQTTSVGQRSNISWCELKARTPGKSCSTESCISGLRSAAATIRNRGEADNASRLKRPPVPQPTTDAVSGTMRVEGYRL